jgi:hypothetical protein
VQDSGRGLHWVKPGHVTTGKGKGGKDLCQGSSWPGRKRGQKRAHRLAYSCDGKDRNLEKTCSAGGWGGSMGDLPNVTGRSKELQGHQTLSSSACTREKRRHVTSAEEVLEGVGVEGEGMGGAGG